MKKDLPKSRPQRKHGQIHHNAIPPPRQRNAQASRAAPARSVAGQNNTTLF
jgi:hypothetical protein